MSADTKNAPKSFLDQLASLDDKLHTTSNDVDMLADIHKGIGSLLASSGNNEAEIRRLLQARYDEGGLRKETFQLVKSVLDRYATEILPTSPNPENQPILATPLPIDPEPMNDDQFGATTVIPSGFAPDPPGESRVQVGSLLRDRYLLQEDGSAAGGGWKRESLGSSKGTRAKVGGEWAGASGAAAGSCERPLPGAPAYCAVY